MRLLILIVKFNALLLFALSTVSADVIIDYEQVNFYTLAANQESLNRKKIEISGWLRFGKYKDEIEVILFPSKNSMQIYNKNEAIVVNIEFKKGLYAEAKGAYDHKFVYITATYGLGDDLYMFGSLNNVTKIHVTPRQ